MAASKVVSKMGAAEITEAFKEESKTVVAATQAMVVVINRDVVITAVAINQDVVNTVAADIIHAEAICVIVVKLNVS
jgi:hypothetical protein